MTLHPFQSLFARVKRAWIWLVFCFVPATSSLAQSDFINWYQVEVLAFTYVNPNLTSNERWPPTPELAFPEMAHQVEGGNQYHVVEDSNWRLPLSLALQPLDPWQSLVEDYRRSRRQDIPDSLLLRVPRAHAPLDEDELDMAEQAQRLRRSRDYRVLYHSAWRQPVKDSESALPIVIDGGRKNGEYSELQGTIRLYASRYLHLETDLWLNSDHPSLEHSRAHPPLTPESSSDSWEFRVDLEQSLVLASLPTDRAAEYPYLGAVSMQSKRRMRSGEQHYIDHPMFGLLIKLERFNAGLDPDQERGGDLASLNQ